MARIPFRIVDLVSCHHKVNFPRERHINCMPLNRGNSRGPGDMFGSSFQEARSGTVSAASCTDFSVAQSSTVLPTHYFAIGNKCFGYVFVYCLVVSQQFVVIMFIFLRGEVNLALIKANKTVWSASVDWRLWRVVTRSSAT